jgi:hypothetical protein
LTCDFWAENEKNNFKGQKIMDLAVVDSRFPRLAEEVTNGQKEIAKASAAGRVLQG